MMKAIHLICRHDDRNQPNNVTFDPKAKAFWSGNWDLSDEDAQALIKGWIYLHVTKSEPSYYGGPVFEYARVKITGVAHEERVKFRFQPSLVAKALRWRGRNYALAWTGGLIDATEPHEQRLIDA